jgi:hypothetical protein
MCPIRLTNFLDLIFTHPLRYFIGCATRVVSANICTDLWSDQASYILARCLLQITLCFRNKCQVFLFFIISIHDNASILPFIFRCKSFSFVWFAYSRLFLRLSNRLAVIHDSLLIFQTNRKFIEYRYRCYWWAHSAKPNSVACFSSFYR